MIAKFLDAELRSGNKGQTEEEMETLLDKALILFRYISVRQPPLHTQSLVRCIAMTGTGAMTPFPAHRRFR